jgi:thiosulfate/3-mercaptopyruvate sulfurtransferase
MTIHTRITAEQLHALLATNPASAAESAIGTPDPNPVVVIDVSVLLPSAKFDGDYRSGSGVDGWLSHRIPGSIHVDLTTELRRSGSSAHFPVPTGEVVAELLARLGIDEHTEIVLYDNRGDIWAARLWWTLASFGVAARVLPGGVSAWEAAGYRVLSGAPAAEPDPVTGHDSVRTAHPRLVALDGFWATQDDVLDIVAGRRTAALVCALDPATFAGTRPTRYSRRGHIPGSVNIPARGIFDDAESVPDGEVVVYCGGGISACLVAFALVEAGRPVSVYSGSIEEWSASVVLPLEQG